MAKFAISGSPHLRDKLSTARIMQLVCLALLPAGVMSVVYYGLAALKLIIACVATCVISEAVFEKLCNRPVTVCDWSAVVTGLLLAYNLPATAPVWVAVFGSVIAIVLVKQMFGGIGANFMNPALTARAILFVSFGSIMAAYTAPAGAPVLIDGQTSATPLALIGNINEVLAKNPDAGTLSGLFLQKTSLLDLALGNCGGVLGETCKLAILAGGLFLCALKIADWKIPAAFIGTAFVCYLIKGGLDLALIEVLSGGLLLGAFFMATDYATSPVSNLGRVIMGIGCGFLLFAIREWASYPEGCSFAILLMNVCTPLIDRFTMPKRFGEVKKHA